jgi:hypothetical protein
LPNIRSLEESKSDDKFSIQKSIKTPQNFVINKRETFACKNSPKKVASKKLERKSGDVCKKPACLLLASRTCGDALCWAAINVRCPFAQQQVFPYGLLLDNARLRKSRQGTAEEERYFAWVSFREREAYRVLAPNV